MIYADIIIDISSDKLDRSFQYRVPERLEKKIKAGMVAAIPLSLIHISEPTRPY